MLKPISNLNNVRDFFMAEPGFVHKQAYFSMTEHPLVKKFLEKIPAQDIFTLCKEYEKNPELYEDALKGKVTYFTHGLQDKPLSIFEKNIDKNKFDELANGESLASKVLQIFEALDKNKNIIKKISIGIVGNKFRTVAYNKNHFALVEFTHDIKHKDGIIFKMLDFAENKRLDLFRE